MYPVQRADSPIFSAKLLRLPPGAEGHSVLWTGPRSSPAPVIYGVPRGTRVAHWSRLVQRVWRDLMRRLIVLLATLAALAGSARAADALTIRDIIELTKAGLPDEVLLALIDVDRGVYATDPATSRGLTRVFV